MSIVYTPHVCVTPSRYRDEFYKRVPAHTDGTIWRCDECERYWRLFVRERYRYPAIKSDPYVEADWRLIQPWHLISVLHLLRAEARPDHLYLKEQS